MWCIITGGCNGKNPQIYQKACKKCVGKYKDKKGYKTMIAENIFASDATAIVNSENSLIPSQIYIKPHTKGLYISQFLLTDIPYLVSIKG